MAKEKSAGAIIYRVSDEKQVDYLLLQPAPGKPWGFPKGKLDPGETEVEAARREIAEESGLSEVELDPDFRLMIHYDYYRRHTLIKKDVIYFIARACTDKVRISHEHVAYRWATLPSALELVVYENAREALRKASEHLAKRYGYVSA